MTRNLCIPVKNALSLRAVILCEGELILLCEMENSVSSCLVIAVYKFDSRPVKNRTPNIGKPLESRPNGDLSF
jgi:hypothetical protein